MIINHKTKCTMKLHNNFLKKVLLVTLILAVVACNKDEPVNPSLNTFAEVIAQGYDFEPIPQSRTVDTLAVAESINEDYQRTGDSGVILEERFVCTKKTLSVLDGNGQFPLFDTNADVIYPGSLLQGKTLSEATPSPIVVKRAGGTISYNLNNGNLRSSFSIEEVKKSTIQDGMNNIIAGAGTVVPANFQLDIIQIESESQLAIELGIDVKTFATKVSVDMSFSTEKTFNRTLIKLNQSYYTMSFDLPTSLEEIFDKSVTPTQLSTYVQADNPATFISSVTYGRIFYMLVESTSSRQEMESKLNIAYGAFNNKVEGELGVSAFKSLKNLKIKMIAYGGDANGTFQLAGETTVAAIANKLAESTDVRAGLPLSYVVRSVERPDKIVGTKLAVEYDVVECELKGILPPQGYRVLVDLFKDDADGGGIGAMVRIKDSNILFYNKAGTKYAWYNGNSAQVLGTFSIDDNNGPMGASTLEHIGAGIQFLDNRLYMFSGEGLRCEIMAVNVAAIPNNALPTGSVVDYTQENGLNRIYFVNEIFGDTGNFQLANRGFSAAVRVGVKNMAYFGNPGDEYSIYSPTGNGSWGELLNSSKWFINNSNGLLFDRVGAASFLTFGGSSGRWIFVNESGDEFMEYYSTPAPKFEGPWVIN